MPPDSICIIGNLNIDLILRGVPGFPAWGQEVMGSGHDQFNSGQAGYLALALRRLGLPVSLIANVGSDLAGSQILADLQSAGVDTRGVTVTPGATGLSVAMVRPDGERAFITDLACLKDFSEAHVEQNAARVVEAGQVCLVGLFCVPGLTFEAAARQLEKARRLGKPTMLDTGWDPHNWPPETLAGMRLLLRHVSLFLPNWDEARAVSGKETVEEAAAALQSLGPQTVVIKRGELGAYALSGEGACAVPARRVTVLDAVGAGDVFNAGFLCAQSRRWPLEACLAFGSAASSLYISRSQNRFPTFEETLEAGREYPALRSVEI